MKSQILRSSLFLCILAGFLGGPSQDIADAQLTILTLNYRLVSSSQSGTTVTQTVEFQITNTAEYPLSNVIAGVLLASSTDQRVETIALGNILAGQTLISSHDFVGPADLINQAFSSGTLTLAIEYDDAAGIHQSAVVTAVQMA